MAELTGALAAVADKSKAGEGSSGGALPTGLRIDDITALAPPGARSGEQRFIREEGKVMAYVWDAGASTWECLGEVTGAAGAEDTMAAASKVHGGRTWDYVFDVDVEDGKPPLKLPYDLSEDPFTAADRFLLDNDLPMSYRSVRQAGSLSGQRGIM